MTLAFYGILAVLALFIVLMVFNPNLSCFGRRLKSPLYPLLRRKKQKRQQTTDYGFNLVEQEKEGGPKIKQGSKPEASPEDYGFNLWREKKNTAAQGLTKADKLVADEYGFDLRKYPKRKKTQDNKDPDRKTD